MKKLFLAAGGAAAVGAAAVALGVGSGHADSGSGNSSYNMVGEPYAKAVAILHAEGVKATFGGSVGSDVPQAQCIVASEKVLKTGHVQLELDCTAKAQPDPGTAAAGTSSTAGTSGASATQAARPTPGAPGIVTVIPTAVG